MINFYLSGNPVHDAVIKSFYDGCPESKKLINNFEYTESDVSVIFGFFKKKIALSIPRGMVFAEQRKRGLDVVVLETGYINRGDGPTNHYAAGLNGLNGRADFRNTNMPSDRAEKLQLTLKPWKKEGEFILLAGQVPWDASVDHIDMVEWLKSTIINIKKYTSKSIIFRPHPLANLPPFEGCIYSTNSLLHDLDQAHAVVCFNSNIGVDSVLDGVPIFIGDDGSMVKSIANTDLTLLDKPLLNDRRQWLNDIAYSQWTPAEMSDGYAWKHLFHD
jgi:hypothetical protein